MDEQQEELPEQHFQKANFAKPKSQEKPEPKHIVKKNGMGFFDKLFIFIIVVSAIYVGYLFFQEDILKLLQMNPYVWGIFSNIADEISQRTLMGLFYASFFGSLFFIFLPLEFLFLYYLTLGYSIPTMVALALIGNVMGLCLDYLFGFTLGARVIKFFFRNSFDRFHDIIMKWGAIIILGGNVIPFPIQAVSVIVGSARYSFKKFFLFTVIGIVAKLVILIMVSAQLGAYL